MQPFSPESLSTENSPTSTVRQLRCQGCSSQQSPALLSGCVYIQSLNAAPELRDWQRPSARTSLCWNLRCQVICSITVTQKADVISHYFKWGFKKTCPTTPGISVFNCKESSSGSWGCCIQVAEKKESILTSHFTSISLFLQLYYEKSLGEILLVFMESHSR